MKVMFRINALLQTDLLVELNRCEEGHRKFRDEVIDKLPLLKTRPIRVDR